MTNINIRGYVPASINIFRTADFLQGLILSYKPHITDRVMGVRVAWNVSRGGGVRLDLDRGAAPSVFPGVAIAKIWQFDLFNVPASRNLIHDD